MRHAPRAAAGLGARERVPNAGTRNPAHLRQILQDDGHTLSREGKTRCPNPSHEDRTPSAHVYDDPAGGHVHCYACGWHVDAYTYLTTVQNLTPREALDVLEGGSLRAPLRRQRRAAPTRAAPSVHECQTRALPDDIRAAHMARALRTRAVPACLQGRGMTLQDLRRLRIAGQAERATLPIFGPDGQLLRLKLRRAPDEPGPRYTYLDETGTGTPAWCSYGFMSQDPALVVEGELNAMSCWLARPDLAVVGVAGTNGSLPLRALAGRRVYVYADGDEPGQDAVQRWTRALQARRCRVAVLPAWDDGDACDIAGRDGRAALRERLS